ncbi:hypothetical protein [Sutcliffiella deserti]|uniref:hypothetical protein n=1 Tax=Sutcliffiella deserti TaxID=2875501 RepID=UPI001CBBDE4F|nr:hypothetical protein [Sutcliffiella deserti]
MVTAIVIPALLIYFYWITRKEFAKQRTKWKSLGSIKLEARVSGEVCHIATIKKRYFYNYFLMVTTIKLRDQHRSYTIVWQQPFTEAWDPPSIQKGDHVHIYGAWNKDVFYAGEVQKDTPHD